MRTTKQQLIAMFNMLIIRMCPKQEDRKSYHLDYNSTYGGYMIEKIVNPSGGVDHPLGARRRSLSEMYDAMQFAYMTLAEYKQHMADCHDFAICTDYRDGEGFPQGR